MKKRKVFGVIAIIFFALFAIRLICFQILIVPRWLDGSQTDVSCVIVENVNGQNVTYEIRDKKALDDFFALMCKTPIRQLVIEPEHKDMEVVDVGILFRVEYVNGDSTSYRIGGLKNRGNLIKGVSDSDHYWIYGEQNEDLYYFLSQLVVL